MENTRTLKGDEVPSEAIDSVMEMIGEMGNELVSDFQKQLGKKELGIDPEDLQLLKQQVIENARSTFKIFMTVNIDLVNELEIIVYDKNQAKIESF